MSTIRKNFPLSFPALLQRLSVGVLGVLSACTALPPAVPVQIDPVATVLDEAIAKKSTQKATGPEVTPLLPKYGDRVSVSFLGDATTLLSDVVKGRGLGWSFSVGGPQPRLPIYVQVNVKDVAFNDFMGEVAQQLGQRADIVMNGKAIELRYRAQN